MTADVTEDDCAIPPWKREVILRRNALARTVEPNLSFICKKLEDAEKVVSNAKAQYDYGGLNAKVKTGDNACNSNFQLNNGDSNKDRYSSNTKQKNFAEEQYELNKRISPQGRKLERQETAEIPEDSSDHDIPVVQTDQVVVKQERGHNLAPSPIRKNMFEGSGPPDRDTTYNRASPRHTSSGQSVDWDTFDWDDGRANSRNPAYFRQNTSREKLRRGQRVQKTITETISFGKNDLVGTRSDSSKSTTDGSKSQGERIFKSKAVPKTKYRWMQSTTTTTVSVDRNDSTVESGNESESSTSSASSEEEIHYGPGFVSRLKNKYMSVALKESGKATNLRRIASLEDFMDDKGAGTNCRQNNFFRIKGSRDINGDGGKSSKRALSKHKGHSTNVCRKNSIQRAQSVEVLSVIHHQQVSPPRSVPRRNESVQTDLEAEAPPPLPPKAGQELENNPKEEGSLYLAKKVSILDDTSMEDNPRADRSRVESDHEVTSVEKLTGTKIQAVIVSSEVSESPRRPLYKRRSSGMIHGIEEAELPAPDTVKETRKIFESRLSITDTEKRPTLTNFARKVNSSASKQTAKKEQQTPRREGNSSPLEHRILSGSEDGTRRPPLRLRSRSHDPSDPRRLSNATSSATKTDLITSSGSTFQIPPLRPVRRKVTRTDEISATCETTFLEEGFKRVSSESISKIRQGGLSISFNFRDADTLSGSENVIQSASHVRQVGVIRPIARDQHTRSSNSKLDVASEVASNDKDSTSPTTKSWKEIAAERSAASHHKDHQRHRYLEREKNVTSSEVQDERNNVIEEADFNDCHKSQRLDEVNSGDLITNGKGDLEDERIVMAETTEDTEEVMDPPGAKDVPNKFSFKHNWQQQNTEQNSLVFNFVNTDKETSHIENDGRDISKRIKSLKSKKVMAKDSGVIILAENGVGSSTDDFGDSEDSDDSEIDVHRPVSPCNIVFVGANVATGKSSIRHRGKQKKLSLTFSTSLTEIFEYPKTEAATLDHVKSDSALIKANNVVGTMNGLGKYTPSKIQLLEEPFQLGVSREQKHKLTNNNNKAVEAQKNKLNNSEDILRPIEDATSWSGSSTYSDLLF